MKGIYSNMAQRLKALRQAKKLTQKQMAERLDVTERHYQEIEYGHVNIPVSTLIFLADFFCVSTDYLLGRDAGKEGEQ